MARKKTLEEVTEMVTPKEYNNSIMTEVGQNIPPGDNNRYTTLALKIFMLPSIDLNDSDAVQERIAEYFRIYAEADTKPTVAGLANSLGIDRRRLWEIKSGCPDARGNIKQLPKRTVDSVKKAYAILEENWENFMGNGKINPVSGIFLGKNNFGYRDQQEYVVTPNTKAEEDYSEEDIRKRYLTDGSET